jgi:hypothetical protein
MHAVVFQVDVKDGRAAGESPGFDEVMASTKAVPGFVRGSWMTDGRRALSVVFLDSEAGAREMAADASVPAEAPVTLRSADVYEVIGES